MKKKLFVRISILFLLFINNTLKAQTNLENSKFSTIIKDYIEANSANLGLASKDFDVIQINNEYYSKEKEVDYLYLNQTYNGIPIYNAISTVAIKNNKVIYFANKFFNNLNQKVTSTNPDISEVDAIYKIATQFNLGTMTGVNEVQYQNNVKTFSKGSMASRDIEVSKKLFYIDNELRLVWDVTLLTKEASNWWRIKVDAKTNEILDVNDYILTCNFDSEYHNHDINEYSKPNFSLLKQSSYLSPLDGSSYNVFALPIESPNHGNRSIVTEPASSLASPFGWHDTNGVSGPEFTITRGNNVYAQEDRNGNNGLGFSPDGTASLEFNFDLNLDQPPSTYESASTTNLFYLNNMMHDIWFHHGFDEVSGNFQTTNYTNQGFGNDFVFADAQDGSGINNATFGTPPDGQNPSMTMFLWSPPGPPVNLLNINNSSLLGGYFAVPAGFGAEITTIPVTANLVAVNDQIGDVVDACEPLFNPLSLAGNIAVIRRGTCQFGFKVLQAEQAGAIGVIVVNNVLDAPITMGPGNDGANVTIPSVMVSQVDGEAILTALSNNESINATLVNSGPFEIDGSFDNVIIGHEYGHGISNRLTGGAFSADCLFNEEQMGEGWSDWFGLMVTMKPTDTADLPRGIGTFAISQATDGNGIRPARYSPNFSVNSATYGLTNNSGLSVPHGVGFVWATMLWDLTWAYIDKYGFDEDLFNGTGGNNKVMQLVIDGLKLQPCNPGFVDGRDALLAADMITTGGEDQCMIWEVFSARGLGFNAAQGDSNSRFDQVEDFSMPPANDISLINCTTLSSEDVKEESIKLYPNPVNNVLNISTPFNLGEVSLTVTDINGRVILNQKRELNATLELDVSFINKGVYILVISGDTINYSTKIIKD